MKLRKHKKDNAGLNRRNFVVNSLLTGMSMLAPSGIKASANDVSKAIDPPIGNQSPQEEEILYNGIKIPIQWPPRNMAPNSFDPMPIPYLVSPPDVIPIDVGRQLFIDDFLIEYTTLEREFHQPVKHEANPIIKPETKTEKIQDYKAAAPFSDGCFYDPKDNLFKLWYMAGWCDATALATSVDGIHWDRPTLEVVPGTNVVLPSQEEFRRDGLSVWLDHDAENLSERFKMFVYERKGKLGSKLNDWGGFLLTSPDGIHWKWSGKIGATGDNTTFFYNPFRKKWVFTVRTVGRPKPPWIDNPNWGGSYWGQYGGRARSYWENTKFLAALGDWEGYKPAFWFGADKLDKWRENYEIGSAPQIYKVDAVGYESLMIGLIQLHYGPPNEVCARGGFPKLTELQIAFSRDGFHWDRTNRNTFIGATLKKNSWERSYIHSVGGVCNIVGDKLYFFYTGFQGDESIKGEESQWNGMYSNASTGLAVLRRDGFASMNAGKKEKILLTRPLQFSGRYLFVNIQSEQGSLVVEVCKIDGKPIPGFTYSDCTAIKTDSTKCIVKWNGNDNLQSIGGEEIRLKFYLTSSKIYSFWISKNLEGASGGATAAGGPGLTGNWDI